MEYCDSKESVKIKLKESQTLSIYAEAPIEKNTLLDCTESNNRDHGEEPIQLLEGCSYEYKLSDKDCRLTDSSGNLVKKSRIKGSRNTGRISPGIYVGKLALLVERKGEIVDKIAVEVRSIKADYRTEYRTMLEDITKECTELLMIHSSPVTQRFNVDYEGDSQTLYQRFAFVKSIVDSEQFRNAVYRVISMPVTTWTNHIEERDIRRARRITPSQLRQIASRNDRINLPENHNLRKKLSIQSIPSRITSEIKIDTVDTPENRFVKHVLQEFQRFSGLVIRHIEKSKTRPNIYYEAKNLEEKFGTYLNHNVFREISSPVSLPLNSPILQRKEGYREILRVWLMFDLAAKLTWKALDDDKYDIGKRDVATLYEYWLFFKLLRLIEKIFSIDPKQTKKLIKEDGDGMGLTLESGIHTAVEGDYSYKGRHLKIQFSYNRTFGKSNYPDGGSWTKQMRPDYTLSLWPADETLSGKDELNEAEKQELIVHIHFDAKYKVEGLKYLISEDVDEASKDLDIEKNEQKEGTYKRADLLKMHAYKDAIRRTAGAYVLYPGKDKPYKSRGFHEIVPGLGAFAVSPSDNGTGLEQLESFIREVVGHFAYRASQREKQSYHTYQIHKEESGKNNLFDIIPEKYKGNRVKPPTETFVLIGFIQDKQKDWVERKQLYNTRFDEPINLEKVSAKYLILYDSFMGTANTKTNKIYGIKYNPRIWEKKKMLEEGYPSPSREEYFVYKIESINESWIEGKVWDISQLDEYKKTKIAGPFTVSLAELMQAAIF